MNNRISTELQYERVKICTIVHTHTHTQILYVHTHLHTTQTNNLRLLCIVIHFLCMSKLCMWLACILHCMHCLKQPYFGIWKTFHNGKVCVSNNKSPCSKYILQSKWFEQSKPFSTGTWWDWGQVRSMEDTEPVLSDADRDRGVSKPHLTINHWSHTHTLLWSGLTQLVLRNCKH